MYYSTTKSAVLMQFRLVLAYFVAHMRAPELPVERRHTLQTPVRPCNAVRHSGIDWQTE